ncbi:hypothetical protein C9374_003518 [Naegleria lovaniensis]|uniref:OTU domain-containing protein n=1 Tax=Naegleria lovaniensis TaxID=51637 RepID=A0AA88KKF2_NAELO|nr:uncharacterized protein C9374_003518 [Naegleria lovaniensis]KAG2385703.1 hypothetical protein C9374_003518 [Naegleria lovaniensis]
MNAHLLLSHHHRWNDHYFSPSMQLSQHSSSLFHHDDHQDDASFEEFLNHRIYRIGRRKIIQDRLRRMNDFNSPSNDFNSFTPSLAFHQVYGTRMEENQHQRKQSSIPITIHRKSQHLKEHDNRVEESETPSSRNLSINQSKPSSMKISIHDSPTPSESDEPQNSPPTNQHMTLSQLMSRKHLRLIHATANGNCLFNCISLALAQSEEYHSQIRQKCVDWIETHLDTSVSQDGGIKVRDLIFLSPYQESIEDYLHEMRKDREWADYCCLNSLANLLNVQLDVYYVNMLEDGDWDHPSSMVVKSKIKVLPTHVTRGEFSPSQRRKVPLKKIRVVYHEELKHYNLLAPQYHTSML